MAFIRRFTVGEYHRLIEQGFFADDEQFELLDGYLVRKMSRNPPHDSAVTRLTNRFYRCLPAGWVLRVQLGITLADSEPEPDLVLARGDESTFDRRHPSAADIGLLVEVSDTSLDRDLMEKAGIYAGAAIPVYWVVNIPDRRIEVFTDPTGPCDAPKYQTRTEYPVGTAVPVVLDRVTIGSIVVAEVIA
jgi:Uma2 family endonuclease